MHRPGFYAERFQRFMCNTVFKKIPCKWLLPDDPPVAPLPQEMGGRTPVSGSCKGQRPLLLYLHPVRAASRLYVSHSVCPSRFRVAAFPLALPTCVIEVRAFSGELVGLQKCVESMLQSQIDRARVLCTGSDRKRCYQYSIFCPCPKYHSVLRLVAMGEAFLIYNFCLAGVLKSLPSTLWV